MENINIYHNRVYEFLDFISAEEQKFFLDIVYSSTEKD
jgi:hypothetical protein